MYEVQHSLARGSVKPANRQLTQSDKWITPRAPRPLLPTRVPFFFVLSTQCPAGSTEAPESISLTKFIDLGLHKQVLKAVTDQGYETPTPIQAQAIPHLLANRDLLGIAQTGTGKTAAFALPSLHHLVSKPLPRRPRHPRVLVLAPTRELALQIAESFKSYARFMDCTVETVFGGVKIGRQVRALQKGPHIVVATPGRLLDLVQQEAVNLSSIDILVLDEADQMLDMGFIHDLRKIIATLPTERQTLLFSATMPAQIVDLSAKFLKGPVHVSVTPQSTTAERVNQGVLHVPSGDKLRVLTKLLEDADIDRALVFTRTKYGADKVVRKLIACGIPAEAIHGNKSQSQRVRTLDAFRDGRCRVLIATDIAARGIDVEGVSHVINFEMPNVAEQYVHRIGRTARAGASGLAISLVAEDELYYLREIEKLTHNEIEVLIPPAGCEDVILPPPDRSVRVRKPKKPGRASKARVPSTGSAKKAGGASPHSQRNRNRRKRPTASTSA